MFQHRHCPLLDENSLTVIWKLNYRLVANFWKPANPQKRTQQLSSAKMATKLTLCTQAISALTVQAKKFGAMSVHFAKSADLATSQANEIAVWTSKLIEAVTRIRQDAEDAAAASQEHVQDKVCTLKTQADSAKRKILDTSDLDSPRTIKANFRLIFGPPRETEHKSISAKAEE